MPSHSLTVLGLDVSFKAEADQHRVENAKKLVENRFRQLDASGRQLSKEKLLTFVALGLADDLLQCNQKVSEHESQLLGLLAKIEEA